MQPLSGIKVIEAASFITGPYASMLLADLGAEVIKIERPMGGDPYRAFKGSTYSSHFRAVNRNKRSITLDLTKPEGARILRELAAGSDVLIENSRPGFMEGRGLGYSDLQSINSDLVYVSVTGFGDGGPYRHRPSYDTVGQALSGLFSLSMDPADPRITGIAISDGVTGLYACYAAMAGLAMRERTGQGSRVETSMLAATLSFTEYAIADYLINGTVPGPEFKAERSQSFALRCADGKVISLHLSSSEKFWQGVVIATETPDLATDPRFSARADRIENYQELRTALAALFIQQPRTYWTQRLDDADVPFAPVYTIDEVVTDPQVEAMGLIHALNHPSAGTTPALRRPVLIDGDTGQRESFAPPTLGEHTDEILGEIGYDADGVAKLRQAGIV